MAYDGKIINRAFQRFDEERRNRQELLQKRRDAVFLAQPRLREIDKELQSTMSRLISNALQNGQDTKAAINALREKNLALQAERKNLLANLGLPPDYLDDNPACPLCGDTGYNLGAMCRCLKKFCAQEQKSELSKMLDLGSQSFETFSLDWYSEELNAILGISARENMDWIRRTCRRFADSFGPDSGNLLMTGDPGLGKTFLSAAIARVVSSNGWSVVYDTAAHVFERFEARKFGRESGEEIDADVDRVLVCDLLILDDLGTEMTTPFVQSALYSIINGRLLERRSTIVSTNLKTPEISRRYSPQIASRLEGEYHILPFFGNDIRKLKKTRKT